MTSERKCEYLTDLLSVLVRTDANLIVSAHQSAYKAEILTQSITNSIWCQIDGINQKAAQIISQLVDSNTSTFMPNPINMFHISVHSANRKAS